MIQNLKMRFFTSFFIPLLLIVQAKCKRSDICSPNTLAVYKLRMDTHWSKETFPKQYPLFRPPAQFSRLLGVVHNVSYTLWRDGIKSTPEVQMVAEKGNGELLEQRNGARDVFAASAVVQGVGSTETVFYSDGKHTLVSVISKIVPSPDWFVGLDSFQLCSNGHWVKNASIDAGPFDAGTDMGFTFTAPNWPSVPMTPITQITSQNPSHPANSFYYPEIKTLPPLVTFHIIKERVYRAMDSIKGSKRNRPKHRKTDPVIVNLPKSSTLISPAHGNSVHRLGNPTRTHVKFARLPVECIMSQWTPWSSCSASCGVGFESRTRTLLKPSKRKNGLCLKETQEKRWCGEQTNCIDRFFNW